MRSPSAAAVLNAAVQLMLPVTVTMLPQPMSIQPENVDPVAAVAVRATRDPLAKLSLQSLPQLIPVAVIVPLPLPALLTVNV